MSTSLLGDLPDAAWEVPTQVSEGDVLLIGWTAVAEEARAGGAGTCVVADDAIRVRTVLLSLERPAQAGLPSGVPVRCIRRGASTLGRV
ncbi:hypothetical protein ACI79G_12510 [Geodermatophilus sp. SYSU D00779]